MSALGLIETKGLLPAVEAADVMLKTAEVRLLDKSLAGGGLVTITVCGEVAAVKASVDAAQQAVLRISGTSLISAHVIARPDEELIQITPLLPPSTENEGTGASTSGEMGRGLKISFSPLSVNNSLSSSDTTAAEDAAGSPQEEYESTTSEDTGSAKETSVPSVHDVAALKQLSLNKLRSIALEMESLPIPREEIASAGKKRLLEAITHIYRQKEE